MISFGMLKFQGVSVVRNMLIVTLLLAGALFAVFYSATNYIQGATIAAGEDNDMSYRYLGDADGLTEHDVESAAADYGVKIINYREVEVEPGTFLYINRKNNTEHYWFLPDDLDMAENTDTGVKKELAFAGDVEYSSFFMTAGRMELQVIF